MFAAEVERAKTQAKIAMIIQYLFKLESYKSCYAAEKG